MYRAALAATTVLALTTIAPASLAAPSVTAPSTPESFAAVPDNTADAVTLTWSSPADDGGSAVTGYQVAVDNGAQVRLGVVLTHAFTGLSKGTHTFTVQALNSAGAGPASSVEALLLYPPRVARAVTAVARPATVRVRWEPPTENPQGYEPAGYRVTLRRVGGVSQTRNVSPDQLALAWPGLAAGVAYRVGVTTVNGSEVSRTAWSEVVRPTGPPRAPTRVKASPGPAGGAVSARVTWSLPRNTGALRVKGYRVLALRVVDGKVVRQRESSRLHPAARSLSMRLAKGNWRFRVRATNRLGWGPYSPRTSAVAPR